MPNFRVGRLDAIWDLLASIRAPQLNTLIIHMRNIPVEADPPSLDKGYTFPVLNKLYLLAMDLEPRIVPALTHMTSQATHVILSNENIQTILKGGFASVVWPWLKTFTCNIESAATIDEYVTFVKHRPKDLITFRILPAFIVIYDAELEALRVVAVVVSDFWDVDEPFWPLDVDRFGPYYDQNEDCFHLDNIYA
jgi:hypothetical protein